jgi:predicted transcriptional regulator
MIAAGQTNREIARSSFVTEATVKTHQPDLREDRSQGPGRSTYTCGLNGQGFHGALSGSAAREERSPR